MPVLALALALLWQTPEEAPQVPATLVALDAALDGAEEALRAHDWPRARQGIADLLEAHEGELAVWLRRPRIVEVLRLCSFLPEYRPPAPEALVHGELLSYSPGTGQMRVRYEQGQLGDFLVARASGEVELGPLRPLEDGDFLLHPALFQRAWSITIRGSHYASGGDPVEVVCVLGAGQLYQVSFGYPAYGVRARDAFVFDRAKGAVLDRADPPGSRGEAYELEVRVGESEVLGLWNGKRVLRARKDRKLFGQVGVKGIADWKEIEIAGVAQRSWMRGLADEAFERARREHERRFDAEAGLPAWLRYERRTPADAFATELPEGASVQDAVHVRGLYELLERGDPEGPARLLERVEREEGGDALRVYLAALWAFERGDDEEAGPLLTRLLELDPDFLNARYLQAWLLLRREGLEQGRARFDELAAAHDDPRLDGARALLAFLAGEREQARRILLERAGAGRYCDELEQVASLFCKAESGPIWLETHVVESEHFRVASDIDEGTCKEAVAILETAFDHFAKRIRPLPEGRSGRFRVYLFSGETSYQAYLLHSTFTTAESTAGVFVPSVEQLLIWNTPDRRLMLDTIRHEGLHQYMQRLVGDQPPWLAEGLGEYWEAADFTKSTSRQVVPTPERLADLRALQRGLLPLGRFLRLSRAQFYGEWQRSYLQAWAFVHFLLAGDRASRARFDAILDALAVGTPPDQAVELVFPPEDAPALEAAFQAHLRELLR